MCVIKMILDSPKYILGDQGAVSRVGRKGETKVFRDGRKSLWVPTLTTPFPNGQANAGFRLSTKKCFVLLCPIGEQLCDCPWVPEDGQSRASKRFYVKNRADI